MKKAIVLLSTFFLLPPVIAEPIDWRTATEVSVGRCLHYLGQCSEIETASDGGINDLVASSALGANGATAEASVGFFGDGLSPLLRASAFAGERSAATALAYGAQGYQYTGTTTQTITAEVTLTFSINGASVESGDGGAGIFALLGFYQEDGFDVFGISQDTEFLSEQPRVFYGEGNQLNAIDSFGFNGRASYLTDDAYTERGVISITLNPMDTFYTFGALGVQAMGTDAEGAYVDASNTLLLEFSDSSNLLAFGMPASSVSEPASFALALVILLMMFTLKWRAIKR